MKEERTNYNLTKREAQFIEQLLDKEIEFFDEMDWEDTKEAQEFFNFCKELKRTFVEVGE